MMIYGNSQEYEDMMNEYKDIVNDIISLMEEEDYQKKFNYYINNRKKIKHVDNDVLTALGDAYMNHGEKEKAKLLLLEAVKRKDDGEYADGITLFLRLAQIYIEENEIDQGIECLIHVCEKEVDNYEEAIAHRELTEIWNKYKYLVEGKVRQSYVYVPAYKTPEECTKQIEDIFINQETLLNELQDHLNELSGHGEMVQALNKWERKLYYIFEFWSEVNSGGIDSYLYYHGYHYYPMYKAADEINIVELLSLLQEIEKVFPRKKIPKKLESIQNIMDKKELNFDHLDDQFYDTMDAIIEKYILIYITNNKNHLR